MGKLGRFVPYRHCGFQFDLILRVIKKKKKDRSHKASSGQDQAIGLENISCGFSVKEQTTINLPQNILKLILKKKKKKGGGRKMSVQCTSAV